MSEGGSRGGGAERVLPRGRERVARLERSIGVSWQRVEGRGGGGRRGGGRKEATIARGFRNQGCLMPKWTLFAEMTHPVNMCMHAGREKLPPLSLPFSHFLLLSLFIVPFCGSGGRHAAYFALNAKAGIILMFDEKQLIPS